MAARLLAAKYAIVPKVMRYCLSSALFAGMESYMRSADGQLDSPSADFTLQSTQLHAQCVQHFEACLERYLASEGSSVASFVSLCDSLAAAGDDGMAAFLSLLSSLTDFEAWVSMARDEAKRSYVKRIIAAYAAMAAADQSQRTAAH